MGGAKTGKDKKKNAVFSHDDDLLYAKEKDRKSVV